LPFDRRDSFRFSERVVIPDQSRLRQRQAFTHDDVGVLFALLRDGKLEQASLRVAERDR
jgi:hypothetical protein